MSVWWTPRVPSATDCGSIVTAAQGHNPDRDETPFRTSERAAKWRLSPPGKWPSTGGPWLVFYVLGHAPGTF